MDDYSEHFLEMAFRTDYRKRLEKASGYGIKARDCGDSLEIFLNVKDAVITDVYYYSNGCYAANACGNAVVDVARGRTLELAWDITAQDLANFLETLPAHEMHCADMAVDALKLALTDAEALGQKPWAKNYRSL